MRKVVPAAVALLVLLAASAPAQASRGHAHRRPVVAARVFIGASPFWWGPYPYWYYPYPYWAPPPVVVREEPPVYIQQAPAPPAPPAESYWYYCPSAKGYYPTVPQCPEAWIKVAPKAP